MPTHADALAVMAKAPIPGAAKTRLVPFLSPEEATELARALLIDQLHHLSVIENADLYLVFAPQEAEALMRQVAPASFQVFPQTDGDLGARMQNIFATLFTQGHKNIVLIGADLPPVPLGYFTQAFTYLDGKKSPYHPPLAKGKRGGFDGPHQRVVLGPSRDGGYYLVGLNQRLTALFNNMTWSHDQVFSQTVSKLGALGVPFLQLPTWFDIDTPDDVRSLALGLETSSDSAGKHTLELLGRLEVGRRLGRHITSAK